MLRVLGWLSLTIVAAGCQSQNAYAPFGPPTVPAPASNQLPYYPPGGAQAAAQPASGSTRPLISVTGPGATGVKTSIVADEADREPIRIVENTAPTRTADSGRGKSSSNRVQPATPPQATQGIPARPAAAPQHSTGQSTRLDSAVKPAAHQAAGQGAFREATPATGQWRAR